MDNRGAAMIIALWILAAAAAAAIAAIDAAREDGAAAGDRVLDTRALYAATAAALLAHSRNLSDASWERDMGACHVRAEARVEADGQNAVLSCDIRAGRLRRLFDVGWTRMAGDWTPTWWRER